MTLQQCVIESAPKGRLYITGPSAEAVQNAIFDIEDRITAMQGFFMAQFTMPVRLPDGQFISTGHILGLEIAA